MNEAIQTLFYITYGIIMVLIIWLFLRRPKKRKFFKQRKPRKKIPSALHPKELEEACQILGVSEHATQAEIIKAYKLKMKEYHPDTVAHKGKESKRWAREKTLRIQKVKEKLLKQGGKAL